MNFRGKIQQTFLEIFNTYRVVGYVLIIVILTINVIRAQSISITHDEALTYNRFVSQGWRQILLSFHSNNHVLHSIFMKISVSVFRLSNISVRLPALFGGVIYLLGVEYICFSFTKRKISYILTFAAATSSPFILDYLVVARGYSLALGFLLVSISVCANELFIIDRDDKRFKWSYVIISCLCALSIASNLSFMFVNISLLLVFIVWSTFQKSSMRDITIVIKTLIGQFILLVVPGILLFIIVNPAILKYDQSAMYYGTDTWTAVFDSLINALFSDFAVENLPFIKLGTKLSSKVFAFFLLFCYLLGAIKILSSYGVKKNEQKKLNRYQKGLLYLISITILTIIFNLLAFKIIGLLLPLDRTGLFFIPLVLLSVGIAIDTLQEGLPDRILRYLNHLGLLFMVIYFVFSLNMNYFRKRKYDSGSQGIYLALRSIESEIGENGVGINWLYEPSLNYYRIYYNDLDIPKFTRKKPNETQNVFVLHPENFENDLQFIIDHNIQVYYRDQISNAVVGIIR